MKTLLEDDLRSAGYDLPASGLCYNLEPSDAKALISEGEWLLAEDELVAKEGEEQRYLYLIVSGSVDLSIRDEKGKQQILANLQNGETFGEVAFLRGHISSATSETRGLCILWRMNHDQLLEFIGSHPKIAGQICLNLAGLLADRLQKENTVVSQVKMDLDDAIIALREVSEEDTLKTSALKELQSKVDILNHATRVRIENESNRSKLSPISISSLAVACFAVLAMVGLYNSYDHDAPEQVVSLSQELDEMKRNEEFLLTLKKNIEAENDQLVFDNKNIKILKDSLNRELQVTKEELINRDNEYDALKSKLMETEDELAALLTLEHIAVDDMVLSEVEATNLYVPLIPQDFIDLIKEWSQTYSTLAFPCEVKVVGQPVVLADITLSAKSEVGVGGDLVITRFHPVSEEYVVARIGDSDTFMASVHLNNTDIMEVLAKKFVDHMDLMGKEITNPFIIDRFSQVDQNLSEEE